MDTIIRVASGADLPFLMEHDRHITPAELDNSIRLGRILILEAAGERLGWLRWNLFWDNTSISTGSWDMIPSAALHPSVTPLN